MTKFVTLSIGDLTHNINPEQVRDVQTPPRFQSECHIVFGNGDKLFVPLPAKEVLDMFAKK